MPSIEGKIDDGSSNAVSLPAAMHILPRTKFGIDQALWQTGKDLQSEFKRQVSEKNKTGRIYNLRIRGRNVLHQSSSSGQTPANLTGNYRRSSGFHVSQGAGELTFGNTAKYAGYLESGTTRMRARPGLGNTVSASERNILMNFVTGIRGAA